MLLVVIILLVATLATGGISVADLVALIGAVALLLDSVRRVLQTQPAERGQAS